MLLIFFSVLLTLGIVAFGIVNARTLFGSLANTGTQIASLAAVLDSCVEGISFKEVLQGWVKNEDPIVRGIAKSLWRLFQKEPLNLHGRQGWVVDLESLCDANRAFKSHATSGRTEAMPGILMGIGILFTFLGLTIGVFGLDPTDPDTMTAGVKRLLGGMSLAFLTSIAGIGTGLWWTWMLKGLHARFDGAFADLSEVLNEKHFLLIPEEMNYKFLDYQASASKALEGMEQTMVRAVTRAMNEVGIDRLLERLDGGKDNEKRLVVTLHAIRGELAKMSTSATQTTLLQEQLAEGLGKMMVSQAQAVATPGDPRQQAHMVAQTQKVLSDFGQVHINQAEVVKAIQESADVLKRLMEGARLATGDIMKNHQTMTDHLQRLESHWENYRHFLAGMQGTLEKTLASYQGEMVTSLGRVHEDFDGLLARGITHFSGALKDFEGTLEALSLLVKDEGSKKTGLFGKR